MRNPDRPRCFYCDAPLSQGNHEEDHFPFPARVGGKMTVPACISCHDLKDRTPYDEWPRELWGSVMRDWPQLSRETRIFLAKCAAQFSEWLAENDPEWCLSLEQPADSSHAGYCSRPGNIAGSRSFPTSEVMRREGVAR